MAEREAAPSPGHQPELLHHAQRHPPPAQEGTLCSTRMSGSFCSVTIGVVGLVSVVWRDHVACTWWLARDVASCLVTAALYHCRVAIQPQARSSGVCPTESVASTTQHASVSASRWSSYVTSNVVSTAPTARARAVRASLLLPCFLVPRIHVTNTTVPHSLGISGTAKIAGTETTRSPHLVARFCLRYSFIVHTLPAAAGVLRSALRQTLDRNASC